MLLAFPLSLFLCPCNSSSQKLLGSELHPIPTEYKNLPGCLQEWLLVPLLLVPLLLVPLLLVPLLLLMLLSRRHFCSI
jgi:hypothetical protein